MYSSALRPSSVPSAAVTAQEVAGPDVGEREVIRKARGLRAFASAGRAQEDQVQFAHECFAAGRRVPLRRPECERYFKKPS